MPSTAHTVFHRTAATYDAARARLIPCYDHFYATAVSLIPFAPDAPIRILDLGAGTGLLSAFIRERFPSAHLHLVDLVPSMLDRARQRLGDNNITYSAADYATAPLPVSPDGPWHAIISALSIHHLTDEAKQQLFRRIHSALLPGRVFINAEQVAGPTPELTAHYHQQWLAQCRALGATNQEIADAEYRMQADLCSSVEDQLAWMRAASFPDADCWFKDGRFAVLAATKPA
jgi:tRNA (cmo5U34)-methyltransferase